MELEICLKSMVLVLKSSSKSYNATLKNGRFHDLKAIRSNKINNKTRLPLTTKQNATCKQKSNLNP